MKNLLIIFVLVLTISCKAQHSENDNTIPFILPQEITITIGDKIRDNEDNVFLLLRTKNETTFNICVIEKKTFSNKLWVLNTNRKALVNGKLIPLIFDYDRTFAGVDNGTTLLEKFNSDNPRIVFSQQIIENIECFDFTR